MKVLWTEMRDRSLGFHRTNIIAMLYITSVMIISFFLIYG